MELKEKAVLLKSVIEKVRSSSLDKDFEFIEVSHLIHECQSFARSFDSTDAVIEQIQSKSYVKTFTTLLSAMNKQLRILSFQLEDSSYSRIVAECVQSEELEQAVGDAACNKFQHEIFDLLTNHKHVDNIVKLSKDQQQNLLNSISNVLGGNVKGILDGFDQLRNEKAVNPMVYRRKTRGLGSFRKALQIAKTQSLEATLLNINFNRCLGQGSFGRVYPAELMGRGPVAVKLIPRDKAGTGFYYEVAILQRLAASREVLRLHGWSEITDPFGSQMLAVVTDLYPRNLADAIGNLDYQPEMFIWIHILHQVASGMAYLARHGVYHRDLKPENVLLSPDRIPSAVIADFGLSLTRSAVSTSSSVSMTVEMGGTYGYLAPEVSEGKVSEKSDVYSFGVLSTFVLHREFPWRDQLNGILHVDGIRERSKRFPPTLMPNEDLFEELGTKVIQLLNNCCEIEPALRPHFVELQLVLFECKKKLPEVTFTVADINQVDDEGSTMNNVLELKDHTEAILSVVALSDGCVASGSADHTIRIWDLKAAHGSADCCTMVLTGHTDEVNCIAELRPGRIVSGGRDDTVRVWNLMTQSCITLRGHSHWVTNVAILANDRAASGGDDKMIIVWDGNNGDRLQTLVDGVAIIRCISALQDEDRLASSGSDMVIKIWSISLATVVFRLAGHDNAVLSVTLMMDGRLASAGADRTIRVWSVAETDGECVATLTGHTNHIRSVKQHTNGWLMSASDDRSIRLWDVNQLAKQPLVYAYEQAHDRPIRSVAVLLDGSERIVSGGGDKIVKIRHLPSESVVTILEEEETAGSETAAAR